MRYKKIISLMSNIVLFFLVSVAMPNNNPDNSQTSLNYNLVSDEKVNSFSEKINCWLRIENNTEELQFVSRPKEEDISLDVNGLDKKLYSVSFEERGFENLAKLGIYLRPKCSIEMELAKIEFIKSKEGKTVIQRGNYSVTALWKRSGFPDIKTCNFEVVDNNIPPAVTVQPTLDEYPLVVELKTASEIYYKGIPVVLYIWIKNNGGFPICIMNYTDRYTDFFHLNKKYAINNETIQEIVQPMSLITPHATKGWFILLPGESLSVTIDASEEFKLPNEYLVTATYLRKILVYLSDGQPYDPNYPDVGLIFPPDGQPYYTKQHKWTSNEINITISETVKKE